MSYIYSWISYIPKGNSRKRTRTIIFSFDVQQESYLLIYDVCFCLRLDKFDGGSTGLNSPLYYSQDYVRKLSTFFDKRRVAFLLGTIIVVIGCVKLYYGNGNC